MNKAMFYHIAFLFLLVPVYVSAIAIAQGDGSESDDTCKAEECKKLANTITRQMGYKQPCEDFHNYVCGNWTGDKERKTSRLKKKAVLTLAGLLESAKPSSIASNATKYLVRAYQSCVHKQDDKEALRKSIKKVIAHYNLKSKRWPITKNAKSSLKRSDAYVEVIKKTGPRPIFSYSISTQGDKPVILMTKPSKFYVFEVEKLDFRMTNDMAEDKSETDYEGYDDEDPFAKEEIAYKTFIRETIALINESISAEDAEKVVESIVEIEKELLSLAKNASDSEKREMKLSQLSTLLGNKFLMSEILRRDFQGLNIDITEETKVLVQYADYYKAAVEFMECRSVVELSNYILWTTIRKMAEAQGTLLHKIYVDFKHNTSVDGSPEKTAENTTTLSQRCMRQLLEKNVMYTGGAHYYIKAKFNESDQKDVLNIMEFVNASFLHVLKDNTWISPKIKDAIILKLQNVTPIIGYPIWMLNESIIESLYQFVPTIGKSASFAEYFYYLLENDHKHTLLQMEPERYFSRPNEDIPLRSHAYYDELTDTMAYPAAAIVTHYRRSPIPRSVTYGTIGTILGQLFASLMDRYGGQFKEFQRYTKDTWDDTTRNNFCNRSFCLNHTEECNDTKVPRTDKYEKLIDYFGVRISYQAMKNSKKNYTTSFLPPEQNNAFNTEEKIFFILFGSLYCPFSVNEKKVESRADDEDKYHERLNEIVYNYAEFNKTFNCKPLGSDVCDLMPPEPKNPESC